MKLEDVSGEIKVGKLRNMVILNHIKYGCMKFSRVKKKIKAKYYPHSECVLHNRLLLRPREKE